MSEINEGDIVWAFPSSVSWGGLLVRVKQIYKSPTFNLDYLVEHYPEPTGSWYTTKQKLKPLTPEEKLELATFGKILEVD